MSVSASESGGVLDCPFRERERGTAQQPLNGVRGWSRLQYAVDPVADHPVGDILGKALGKQGLAELRRIYFHPGDVFTDRLADQADLGTLRERLLTGEHTGLPGVRGAAGMSPGGG
jgi:hypothetical protein